MRKGKARTYWTTDDEHEEAKEKAEAHDMSLSQLIRKLLRECPRKDISIKL